MSAEIIPDPVDPGPDWTPELSATAAAEGWDLFDSHGSVNGPWQVQSFDMPEDGDADLGGEDTIAWFLVQRQIGLHHVAVLNLLRVWNPLEYERIVQWPTYVVGHWNYDTDTVVWGEEPTP